MDLELTLTPAEIILKFEIEIVQAMKLWESVLRTWSVCPLKNLKNLKGFELRIKFEHFSEIKNTIINGKGRLNVNFFVESSCLDKRNL